MRNRHYKIIGILFVVFGIIGLVYSIMDFNLMVLAGSIIMSSNGIAILYELNKKGDEE